MGIEPQFDMSAIAKMLEGFEDAVASHVVRILSFVGEKCVNEARTAGAYNDRTGNLRASSGYIVVHGGKLHTQNFRQGEGGAKAVTLARQIAAGNPNGSALIVVAGMNYAAYVEAKGINVLTTAEQLAEREIPNLLRQLT